VFATSAIHRHAVVRLWHSCATCLAYVEPTIQPQMPTPVFMKPSRGSCRLLGFTALHRCISICKCFCRDIHGARIQKLKRACSTRIKGIWWTALTLLLVSTLSGLSRFSQSDVLSFKDQIDECLSLGVYIRGPAFNERPYLPQDPWQNCSSKAYENWIWQPNSNSTTCQHYMQEFYSTNLCDASTNLPLHTRHSKKRLYQTRPTSVLLVGDSLSFQMFVSAILQYGASSENASEARQFDRYGQTSALLCDGRLNMTYIRNDYLVEGECKHCNDFWTTAYDSDVLIFNRGAHVRSDSVTTNQMTEFARRLTEMWIARGGYQLLFWRNTVPGHENCDAFHEPSKFTNVFSDISRTYGWDKIQSQNKLMLKILYRFPAPFKLIDAYTLTIDRPDRHQGGGDCLHYCLPGPPDLWLQSFSSALHTQTQKQTLRRASINPVLLIYWHVPKTAGTSLVHFWKTSSRCILYDVFTSGQFITLLNDLYNIFGSYHTKTLHDFCAIIHVHAGSAPTFMRTRSVVRHLKDTLSVHKVDVYELVTFREPGAYELSLFNYVCLVQKDCGDTHSHTVEEFNEYAAADLQAKYLIFGHVGGWRTHGVCPLYQYESDKKGCFITASLCRELEIALENVFLISVEQLTHFVQTRLSKLLRDEQELPFPHENFLGSEYEHNALTHNSSLVYPTSICDQRLYSIATVRGMLS